MTPWRSVLGYSYTERDCCGYNLFYLFKKKFSFKRLNSSFYLAAMAALLVVDGRENINASVKINYVIVKYQK